MPELDSAALCQGYDEAVRGLAEEAVAIMDAQPDNFIGGRTGPHGAVSLVMSAFWQRPELIHPLADYFAVLERTRLQLNDGKECGRERELPG